MCIGAGRAGQWVNGLIEWHCIDKPMKAWNGSRMDEELFKTGSRMVAERCSTVWNQRRTND